MAKLVGMLGGATVGFLLVIAYNTSSETAALEGGRHHLRFLVAVIAAVAGAVLGLLVGADIDHRRRADAGN